MDELAKDLEWLANKYRDGSICGEIGKRVVSIIYSTLGALTAGGVWLEMLNEATARESQRMIAELTNDSGQLN